MLPASGLTAKDQLGGALSSFSLSFSAASRKLQQSIPAQECTNVCIGTRIASPHNASVVCQVDCLPCHAHHLKFQRQAEKKNLKETPG